MLRQWRSRSAPALLLDAGLAVLVAAANTVAISVAREPGSRPPDALAYGLGVVIGALLLGRRRWPLAILVVSVATLNVYYTLNYPGIAPALPLAVALYTAVAAGHLAWGLPIAAFFIGAGLFVRVVDRHEALLPVLTQMVQQAALFAVVLLLGEAVRNRRRYLAEVRERLQRAEADREREAARRVAEERLRIARELHDVMAHTIAAITVQAGLAIDVLDDSPAEARAALGAIRAASREAMAEVKATVGVLRSSDGVAAPLSPAPGLDQVDGLIAVARGAGLRVEVVVTGDPRPLSAAVDTTAYRIMQESLTNVVRHARASLATVEIRYEPGALGLVVADNGIGADVSVDTGLPEGSGHGLIGMVERASALGGWLKAGPRPSGGFLIEASLPTEEWSA
jgi:signal transduction histidine kinase